ncbi:hypothetical protein NL676_001130 [Syzygium grande]|nr:hypothetical protein NL676_001130 [Syzygium grande]
MTKTLLSVLERSSEARLETQAAQYRVNTVASAVARGWPVRELKRTKTAWTPGRFSVEELSGKWVTSLTPM